MTLKEKEPVTLPLSGKCSHKPRFGFPSTVTPGSPAVGTWAAFTDWLAALKFTSSAHSHWRVLISSLIRAVNMLLFVQPLRSYGLVG